MKRKNSLGKVLEFKIQLSETPKPRIRENFENWVQNIANTDIFGKKNWMIM